MTIFATVDIETLGYEPPAAVIELGMMTILPGGRASYSDFLYGLDGQEMAPENRAVHHISPKDLEGHKPFSLIGDRDVSRFVESNNIDYMVAHKADFEQKWITVDIPWICTYKCAVRTWPDAPKHDQQTLKYYLGIEDSPIYYPPHRALPDARLCYKILEKLIEKHTVEELLHWTSEPVLITKFPFGKHFGVELTEIPSDYLKWCLDNLDDEKIELKYWCFVELERRGLT